MADRKVFIENDHGWNHWTTPAEYLHLVRAVGEIALDPCGNAADAVAARVSLWGPDAPEGPHRGDGLEANWADLAAGGLVYVNPPYSGGGIVKWAAKMDFEALRGCEIIALLPARVDTRWMHEYVFRDASAWALGRGREQFDNPPPGVPGGGSKTPNLTAYWGTRKYRFAEVFQTWGEVVVR